MADVNEMFEDDNQDQGQDNEINKFQKRVNTLSSKVKATAEERDAATQKAETAEAARLAAEKERDFYAGFSAISSKFPNATEYTDKIKEKVMSGYSPEDATVSVLNAEGKLTVPPPPLPPPPPPAAGGSASITLPDGGVKAIGDMSRDEKRAALMEAEARGDISLR